MCLYSKIIVNKRYIKNIKNGGVVPAVRDERHLYAAAKCGKCMECRKQKAREWQVRLLEDIKHNRNGIFITLTFSNESIKELYKESIIRMDRKTRIKESIKIENLSGYDIDNSIATLGMRRFNERYRKLTKKGLRHWMITELGHNGTENIHLHGIIWTNMDKIKIAEVWKYGYVWSGYEKNGKNINYVNEETINYITKYVHKVDFKHKTYISKILCSPGIGGMIDIKNLWNKFKGEKTKDTYKTNTGHEIALPSYWKRKIYSEEEREDLWSRTLDKNTRYVNGKKIDISKGLEEYWQVLEEEREKAIRLGYVDNSKEWERKQYEEDLRNIMIRKRLE